MKKLVCLLLVLPLLVSCSGASDPPASTQVAAVSGSPGKEASEPEADFPRGVAYAELPYATPEAAVTAYVEGVAAGDLAKAFSACAIESYGGGYDVGQWVDTMKFYRPGSDMGPSDYPLYAELNAIMQLGTLARQTKIFAECLTAGGLSEDAAALQAEGSWVAEGNGDNVMDQYFQLMEPQAIAGLVVEEIIAPPVLAEPSPETAEVLDHNARLAGAEQSTQRVAILELKDKRAICAFQLLRYGADWKIASHGAPLINITSTGYTLVVPPEDVEEFKKEILLIIPAS